MNPQDTTVDPLNLDENAIAEGRFTHTPMTINNAYAKAIKGGDSLGYPSNTNPEDFNSGLMTPGAQPKINIELGPGGTHEDTSQLSNHEQIHALLSPQSQQPPVPFDAIKPYMKWFSSDRAGHPGFEIPAYMGSYMKGQIQGIEPSDAKNFQDKLLAKLPPDKAATFKRIIQAQEANKKFWEGNK